LSGIGAFAVWILAATASWMFVAVLVLGALALFDSL